MQDSADQIQGQRQAQRQRKLSPVIVGIGAAVIAAAISVVVMTSGGSIPQTASQQAASTPKECQLIRRRLLVSTKNGNGAVRFRASGWESPPFKVTKEPQVIVFPLPRSDSMPAPEDITIEGSATNIVLTSEITEYRQVFDRVDGSLTFHVAWKPMKGC
jgi:hypothetical protein